jgi:hypothetical protein
MGTRTPILAQAYFYPQTLYDTAASATCFLPFVSSFLRYAGKADWNKKVEGQAEKSKDMGGDEMTADTIKTMQSHDMKEALKQLWKDLAIEGVTMAAACLTFGAGAAVLKGTTIGIKLATTLSKATTAVKTTLNMSSKSAGSATTASIAVAEKSASGAASSSGASSGASTVSSSSASTTSNISGEAALHAAKSRWDKTKDFGKLWGNETVNMAKGSFFPMSIEKVAPKAGHFGTSYNFSSTGVLLPAYQRNADMTFGQSLRANATSTNQILNTVMNVPSVAEIENTNKQKEYKEMLDANKAGTGNHH